MRCNNCQSEDIKSLYKLKKYDVVQCRNCGLRFSYPPLKHDYEEGYFKKEHKEYFSSCKQGYNEEDSPKIKNFKQGLEEIQKFSKKGRIFDIGCATGVFLDICKKNSWNSYGIDISKYATDYAKKKFKVKAEAGEVTKIKNKVKFFDVVSMWDTIEHVENPSGTLKKVRKILKKDGILFISTINEKSLMNFFAHFIYKISFGLIKKPILLLHPEQHLTHFSEESLKDMLNRMGFEIIYKKKLEVPIDNFERGLLKKKIISFFYFFQKIFNREYMIWIIARKSKDL